VTMEEEPRILELTGEDLHKVTHAYGTNGIISEVEMPLTAAYDWVDVIVGFDNFMDAARYGNAVGTQDGLLTKLITPIAAPAPFAYFKRHQKFLREDQSICLVTVAPHSLDAFLAFTRRHGGAILFNAATEADLKGLPPNFELSWNHTTLRALRIDPAITYLQVLYPFPHQIERVETIHALIGDEMIGHLEFVRFDGNVTCFGLPLIRYTTEERLDEIIRLHEENGCPIFNPHRYTLEEGGMKQTDEIQLAFKREADPKGLLNPGKMIAWENPDYDYKTGKVFLFKGLERTA
jgi:FAD/FMN-containing dehydrogenase